MDVEKLIEYAADLSTWTKQALISRCQEIDEGNNPISYYRNWSRFELVKYALEDRARLLESNKE